MDQILQKYKGLHPGLILDRELSRRNLRKGPFALSLGEYPQLLNEITKGRRGITTALSLKMDHALGFEEGTMAILQAWYEIQKVKEIASRLDKPDIRLLRPALFWDTDIDKIQWRTQYRAVIRRVFERGNDQEKREIARFYGMDKIKEITETNRTEGFTLPIMDQRPR